MTQSSSNRAQPQSQTAFLDWIEPIKGLAIVWIIAYHIALLIYGIPPFDHPKDWWPELNVRLAQMRPLAGFGLGAVIDNVARYVSWLGYQGVHLFLVLSGFGLTWSLVRRSPFAHSDWFAFYRRRLGRIFPTYWAAHAFFVVFLIIFGEPHFSPFGGAFIMSLLGLRFTPGTFYAISAAWWYIGLIVQLYLAFPLLWAWLRRKGLRHFWIGTALITLGARFITLIVVQRQVEMWSMGVLFTNRLFEFTFGMGLAYWLARQPDGPEHLLRKGWPLALAFVGYVLSLAFSFTLAGAVVAHSLLAVSLFTLTYAFVRYSLGRFRLLARGLSWLGMQSYALYLLHLPINNWFLHHGPPPASPAFLPLLIGLQGLLVLGAALFRMLVELATQLIQREFLSEPAPDETRPLHHWWLPALQAAVLALAAILVARNDGLLHLDETIAVLLAIALSISIIRAWKGDRSLRTHIEWRFETFTILAIASLGLFFGPNNAFMISSGLWLIGMTIVLARPGLPERLACFVPRWQTCLLALIVALLLFFPLELAARRWGGITLRNPEVYPHSLNEYLTQKSYLVHWLQEK
jgi:peptidoglycan/LPS O-acetylase OafA/YrhL